MFKREHTSPGQQLSQLVADVSFLLQVVVSLGPAFSLLQLCVVNKNSVGSAVPFGPREAGVNKTILTFNFLRRGHFGLSLLTSWTGKLRARLSAASQTQNNSSTHLSTLIQTVRQCLKHIYLSDFARCHKTTIYVKKKKTG